MSTIVQQDATIYSFIKFSAGAHSNCNYIWHWSNRICYRPLTRQRTVANTVLPLPDVVNIVWMFSWWWMRVSSEICRAVCRKYNKTVYSRILLDNYWHWFMMHGPVNLKFAVRTLQPSWCRRHKTEHASSSHGPAGCIMRPLAKLVNGVWMPDTHCLTHFMGQGPSWEPNRPSTSREIPHI